MKTYLAICDICRADGEIRLAAIEYYGEAMRHYHACATHAKDVEKYGFEIIEEYEYKGNPDEGVWDE